MSNSALEEQLLAAHEAHDKELLVTLYADAAGRAEHQGDARRAGFFLTHAWIFALDAGDARATELARKLRLMNRL